MINALKSVLFVTVFMTLSLSASTAPAGNASLAARVAVLPTTIDACRSIQSAINRLPSSGGEISLRAGVYSCDTALVVARDNVSLRGSGQGTRLRLKNGANSPVLVLGETNTPILRKHKNILVADISIDGNRANQTFECWGGECDTGGLTYVRNNGITVRGVEDVIIENVSIKSAISGGIVTEKGCRRIHVANVQATDNRFDGMAGYETEDSVFSGLDVHHNIAAGLSLDIGFSNNLIVNSVIANNGSVGIFMVDAHDNMFQGLQVRNNKTHGVFLAEGSDVSKTASGNSFNGIVVSESGWRADSDTEGFCVDGMLGGVAICVNNVSNVNNLFANSQLIHNRGGCVKEAVPDLLQKVGVICR